MVKSTIFVLNGFQSTPSPRRETEVSAAVFRRRNEFQSTPSPRRETRETMSKLANNAISIHSLPKEGDNVVYVRRRQKRDFNPLPPQGGRRSISPQQLGAYHFNPLPPQGGRPVTSPVAEIVSLFQSTPSPRRETAALSASRSCQSIFQSTPSPRRETRCISLCGRS